MVHYIGKYDGAVEKDHKQIQIRSKSSCWEKYFQQTGDMNTFVNYWSSMFSFVIEKHGPLKGMHVYEKYCSWIGKNLKGLMIAREGLKTAAHKSKSTILMDVYRQTSNRAYSLNVKLKRQYSTTKTSACKGNMKESWKTVNEL